MKPLKINKDNVLLILNVLATVVLTGVVVYSPVASSAEGLLGYPAWSAPLVFLVVTVLFAADKLRGRIHTFLNMCLMILSGVLVLYPVPVNVAETLKWWYPLAIALALNVFTSLDSEASTDSES